MRTVPILLLAGLLAGSASAQQTASPPPGAAATQDATTPPPVKDPIAMDALNRMGNTLRQLTRFTVTGDITDEDVLDDGQKLQYSGAITLKAERPNRFRVDSTSDRKNRSIFYDGKSVTIYAPTKRYYATVPAPATIGELVNTLDNDYGVVIPLADLFSWGTDQTQLAALQSALPVGSDTINGIRCDHFAMRQEGVDWQIWIQQGSNPLPCKYVITTTDDPSMPQYSAVLRWDTATPIPPETYAFTPPPGAQRITLSRDAMAASNTQ